MRAPENDWSSDIRVQGDVQKRADTGMGHGTHAAGGHMPPVPPPGSCARHVPLSLRGVSMFFATGAALHS